MTTTTRLGLAFAALLLASAAYAKDLPNLPHPLQLQQGGDSPGQVIFRHDSHVDADKASCLGCHPARFSVLGRSSERKAYVIDHARMEKGEACGACHGKQAFGFDDCTACHAQ